jgi:hypothetical protein
MRGRPPKNATAVAQKEANQISVTGSIRGEFDLLSDGEVKNKFAKAIAVANFCKKVILEKKLYCEINKNKYVYVRAWKLVANAVGLTPEIDVEKTKIEREHRKSAEGKEYTIPRVYAVAHLVTRDGKRLGTAIGSCSGTERNWFGRDESAILGMAQTRAIGRACKNQLDWLMVMAGFADIPVEEVSTDSAPASMSEKDKEVIEVDNGGTSEAQAVETSAQ